MTDAEISHSELHPNIAQAVTSWRKKPSLRAIYGGFYKAIAKRIRPGGRILEIGAGSGHSRDFLNEFDVVRLDVLSAPWVDVVADAHDVPLPDQSFDGIVMIDVLHHLADPSKFFTEVERLLKPGGRCVMIEPGVTPLSGVFYRLFHEEPVIMNVDPMGPHDYGDEKDPFDSNQAIPTLLFKRSKHRADFERSHPTLSIIDSRWMSLAAYPMTGGFQPWSLLTPFTARALVKIESIFEPILGPLMAFRLLVALEKTSASV